MRRMAFLAVLCATATAASAAPKNSMQVALELGSVLAAEDFCGLHYNQDAIAAFIEKAVPADEMGFPSTLQLMISGSKVEQGQMADSAKAAHCTQIKRIAKAYHFID